MCNDKSKQTIKDSISKNGLTILIIICGLLLLFSFFAPLLFTLESDRIDFTTTGQIGDTISGTMSPFINIIGVILTFSAFYVQYIFNKKQREEIADQKSESERILSEQKKESEDKYKEQKKQIEEQSMLNRVMSFESSFFNMVNLHQSNVANIQIEFPNNKVKKIGSQVIAYINESIENVYNTIIGRTLSLKPQDALIISYLFVYYGSSLYTNKALIKKYSHIYSQALHILQSFEITPIMHIDADKLGFATLLSKYFRNLYQIYNYIDSALYLDNAQNNRYFYSKILRSNISMEEQVLLYYNFISPMGKAWVEKEYVFKYKILRNIPLGTFASYSPIKWMKSLNKEDLDDEYISGYFEFYDDEN